MTNDIGVSPKVVPAAFHFLPQCYNEAERKCGGHENKGAQSPASSGAFGSSGSGGALVSNMRHLHALGDARASLISALDTLKSRMPMDMCTIDISAALESLGLISGTTVSSDIVDKIFAEFCVGK